MSPRFLCSLNGPFGTNRGGPVGPDHLRPAGKCKPGMRPPRPAFLLPDGASPTAFVRERLECKRGCNGSGRNYLRTLTGGASSLAADVLRAQN